MTGKTTDLSFAFYDLCLVAILHQAPYITMTPYPLLNPYHSLWNQHMPCEAGAKLWLDVRSVNPDNFLKINNKILFIMKLTLTNFSSGFTHDERSQPFH
jgi:hypothetical protein